ncbi:MAG: hypothetical protein NTX88_03470 [Candidatus Atribacteria bacterium]|nr:hypothetical protein [Candidatus Atribacteria bacterium]
MKKILLVILVLSCLTWFSMFGFASTRTCTCGQNQPISNSIPTVEQPTVTPSTPSSSGSGGGVTSSSRPLIGYSLLTITRLSFLEGKYRVDVANRSLDKSINIFL